MSRILLAASLSLLLMACTSHESQPTQPSIEQPQREQTPAVQTQTVQGQNIAAPVQLQKPAEVLADVLENYKERTTDCREYGTNKRRGHYYCSGVLVRTVDDGPFKPWIYSPTSIAIGATSYTWIRRGVIQTGLYHPAGFILRNRIDGLTHKVPALATGFICLYPYDGSTSTANGNKGCGLRPAVAETPAPSAAGDDNSAYAFGSCDALNIVTAKEWDNHFKSTGENFRRQCSWNIDSQHGWNNMITSRGRFPQHQNVWNELLVNNLGDGAQMPKYIAAFFYDVDKAGGLTAAHNFQIKMNADGYKVPILRLNFKNAGGNIFSYVAADQAVAQ